MLRNKVRERIVRFVDPAKMAGCPRLTPVDKFAVAEFNKNDHGHVRGIVSALAHCQSLAEYEMICRNLSQRPAQFGCTDGMTFEQAIRTLKPRWCQMPSELNMFAQSLASGDMVELEKAYDKNLNASLKSSQCSSPQSESSEHNS